MENKSAKLLNYKQFLEYARNRDDLCNRLMAGEIKLMDYYKECDFLLANYAFSKADMVFSTEYFSKNGPPSSKNLSVNQNYPAKKARGIL